MTFQFPVAEKASTKAKAATSGQASGGTRGRASGSSKSKSLMPTVVTACLVAPLLLAGAWLVTISYSELLSDFFSAAPRQKVQHWASGTTRVATQGDWEEVVAALNESLSSDPNNPILHESLGTAYTIGSKLPEAALDKSRDMLQKAVIHYEQSLALRPTDALTWALKAAVLAKTGERGSEASLAVDRALALGPNERHVQQSLLLTAVQHWDTAPEQLKDWVSYQFETGNTERRQEINRVGRPYGVLFEAE